MNNSLQKDNSNSSLPSQNFKDWSIKQFSFLKENLKLLLLIPTLLGGLWQTFSLVSIGVSYLRFFSITQLISDGIIILIFLIPQILLPWGTYFYTNNRFSKNASKITLGKGFANLLKTIILSTISFIGLLIASYVGLRYLISQFEYNISYAQTFLLYLIIIPFNLIYQSTQLDIENYLKLFFESNKSKSHGLLYSKFLAFINWFSKLWFKISFFPYLLSTACWIIICFKLLFSIGTYYLPHNLVNFSKINKIIKNEYNIEKKNFKVSYFNDNYIFIEYTDLSKAELEDLNKRKKIIPKKVVVLETEMLFQN